MLKWAFVFLLIAIVAGIFGFTDVEAASATIAQWLFGIFLFLFLGALAIGLFIGAKLFPERFTERGPRWAALAARD